MIELKGEHNNCIIYTEEIENTARERLQSYIDSPQSKDTKIRVMPDVHDGEGTVIGFTSTIFDCINPSFVGVDIGCGVLTVFIEVAINKFKRKDFRALIDTRIRDIIPMGFNSHKQLMGDMKIYGIEDLCKKIDISYDLVCRQLGTLGGGNHFIELGVRDDNSIAITIHTGSRALGHKVWEYYNEKAKPTNGWLYGELMEEYLNDMQICSEYARLNRTTIINLINAYISDILYIKGFIDTTHNYIDLDKNIIRKGAVSADKDEVFVIPLNMKDGVIVCAGKGNEDWNYSAPHGAGRIFSRSKAKRELRLDDFKKATKRVYSINKSRDYLDESPMAYKNAERLIKRIRDTATVIGVIRPILNIKAKKE